MFDFKTGWITLSSPRAMFLAQASYISLPASLAQAQYVCICGCLLAFVEGGNE